MTSSCPALDVRYRPTGAQSRATAEASVLEDLLYAELDAFEPVAIHEDEQSGGWRIFFRTVSNRDAAYAALGASLGTRLVDLRTVEVQDEGWARRSQASLGAVHIGRITVAPPWDSADHREILIVIEPSMGFGTGHHATTRLCLELLQQIDLRGKRAVDVGTGSGVLALSAWALGASSVTAMDNDPDALQNARDNIARHDAADAIRIVEADLSSAGIDPGDVVTANLTAAVLQRCAGALRRLVASDGALIVSGFGPDEIEGVAAALGARPRKSLCDGEWAALLL
jgi:ribosomal protein L11 methyltransferase